MKTILIASHDDAFCSLSRNSLASAGFVVVVVDDLRIIGPLAHYGCIQLAIIDPTFGDDELVSLLLRLREDRTRLAIIRLRDPEVEFSKLIFQCQMLCELRREHAGVELRVFRTDHGSPDRSLLTTEVSYSFDYRA